MSTKRKRSSSSSSSSSSSKKGKEDEKVIHEPPKENQDDLVEKKIDNEDDEEEEEEIPLLEEVAATKGSDGRILCPYMDTVNRSVLDFDFEKVCSVTLSNLNVYACLVCGKYFQGRGKHTQAFHHSFQTNHHMFINLHNTKVYCLPENYEVVDSSLDDIKFVLNPTFTKEEVAKLDSNITNSATLEGEEYLPGVVGLNNIKLNDSINVVLQSLVHVKPLRDFFLIAENYASCGSNLVKRFGELMRKLWAPRNFKSHVSPHEIIQAIALSSKKRFRIGDQCDPIDLISWFLNTLHTDLGGSPTKPTIITETFQGKVKLTSFEKKRKGESDEFEEEEKKKTKIIPFLFLTLDIPPPPLFKDEIKTNIIPQVPLYICLRKFDGTTFHELPVLGQRRQYKVVSLPKYMIFHLKRFTKNNWFVEKNPTIVNFPIKNLDMQDFVVNPSKSGPTRFNMLANIVHEGQYGSGKGIYKVHVLNKGDEQWYELQDLVVRQALPQLISLSESYIQVWEVDQS